MFLSVEIYIDCSKEILQFILRFEGDQSSTIELFFVIMIKNVYGFLLFFNLFACIVCKKKVPVSAQIYFLFFQTIYFCHYCSFLHNFIHSVGSHDTAAFFDENALAA